MKKRNSAHRLAQYRNLLFSTHAILDGDVPGIMEPALVLSLVGDRSDNDGFLTMSEVFGLDLRRADLVVLSACQTALGQGKEPVAGEGMTGLTRAFMYAGARSVLGSLWVVEDASTSLLVQSFFRHLREGRSKAEALNLAKRELRANPAYSNPFYWAPFVLVGED